MSDRVGDHDLYWTCNGCDADYDQDEMSKALHEAADGTLLLICTICGRVGDFRDGPDCTNEDGTWTAGWFLLMGDDRIAQPNRQRREERPTIQGRTVQGG